MAKRKSYDADGNPVNPTLLGRIKSGAVGGLSAAANVLDLPGSSVRDVLAGKNPIDQYADPFGGSNRTSGRDLARQYGLAGRKDTWGNFGGGLAAEIATDPLTYLTFGGSALGKAGKLAKLAGLTDDVTRVAAKVAGKASGSIGKATARLTTTPAHLIAHGAPDALEKLTQAATKQGVNLADVMHEPLGGLAKFWPTGSVLGTGKTAQKIAGVMDKAGAAVRFGKYSPVAPLARLFDAPAKDALNPIQAAAGRRAFQLEDAARATARGHIAEFTSGLMKAGHATEADAPLIREVLEGTKPLSAVNPALHPHIANFKQKIASVPGEAAAAGRKVRIYDDPEAAFIPRRKTSSGPNLLSGGKSLGTKTASQLSRKPYFFGIKGGTEAINRIGRSVAPLIESGASLKDITKHLRQNFKGVIPKTFLSNKDRAATIAAQAAGKAAPTVTQYKTHKAIAKNFMAQDPQVLKQGLFGNHAVADVHSMLTAEGVANARAKAVIESLEQPGALLSKPQTGSVPVRQVLKELGMDVKSPAVQHLVKQHLPGDMAKFLVHMDKGFEVPHAVADTLGKIDWITNLTKLGLTSPWLNFQVRNRASGVFNNFLAGMFSRQSENAAHTLYTGGIVKGAAQIPEVARVAASQGIAHLDDKTATDILRQLSFAHEVASKHEGAALQSAGGPTKRLQDILGEMPGSKPSNPLADIAALYAGKNGATWNPLKGKIRGVAGAEQSTFAPLAGGEAMGHYFESMNRLAPFIHRLQQGATAAQAAKEVGEAQVKYASRNYTKFEQQFLARLFPFMKFTRGMIPFMGKQLAERPGGKLAQTLRAVNKGHTQEEGLPEHITETAAIPLPAGKSGDARFLTGLGLAFEDPAQLVTPDLKAAGNELLSRTNPLLKGTLEAITGRSFFQRGPGGEGRPLSDMDPGIGRTLANIGNLTGLRKSNEPVRFPGSGLVEGIAANSPLSKAVQTLRTATDTRKGIGSKAANLLTGLRVTDVSPQQRETVLRRQADDLLRALGGRQYTESYFPKDKLASLPTAERQIIQDLLDFRLSLDKKRKAQKKQLAKR